MNRQPVVALLLTLGLVLLLVDNTCSTFYRSHSFSHRQRSGGHYYYKTRPVYGKWPSHKKPSGVPVLNPGGASGVPVLNPGGASGVPVLNPGGASGVPVVNPGGVPGHIPSKGQVPPGDGGSNDPGFSLVDNVDVRAKSFGGTCPPGCR